MSEWDNITDLEGWQDKLKSLLSEAKGMAEQGDLTTRLAMSERLTQFLEWSWPNTPEIKALDKIAADTANAILVDEIDRRLAALQARFSDYARLKKQFRSEAQVNQEAASKIRLENVISAIDATRAPIDAFKKLKESLKDTKKEKKLSEAVDETVESIETLRTMMAKLL